jgi:hypothetical protein
MEPFVGDDLTPYLLSPCEGSQTHGGNGLMSIGIFSTYSRWRAEQSCKAGDDDNYIFE